jgi:hypothetical protein
MKSEKLKELIHYATTMNRFGGKRKRKRTRKRRYRKN